MMKWLNEIRSNVEEALDYVWYVGERWSEITHNPKMSWGTIFSMFWLGIVIVPFVIPLLLRCLPWSVAYVVALCVFFLPQLFCSFRYTDRRREALDRKYRHIRNIGSRLAWLSLLGIVLTIAAFRLSFLLGILRFTGE